MRLAALVATAFLAVVAAGCGSAAPKAKPKARIVRVTLTGAGCPASLDLPAGPTWFVVLNRGGKTISEFQIWDDDHILGEIENLAPGRSGVFSLTLRPGRYETRCTGGSRYPRGKLTVPGSG